MTCEHESLTYGHGGFSIICRECKEPISLSELESAREDSWKCFHCGEVFTDYGAAADHFGYQEDGLADEVACRLNATEGLIVKMLREAQAELRTYHQEDNAAFVKFYALGGDHTTALRREEEKGYARGIADMRKELTAKIAEEARRYASHYPQSSDGRNTFVMFAEWVESLQSPPFT